MNKYFFYEAEKEVERVSYRDYKNNDSIMKKNSDTYDEETKSIEVEKILNPFQEWELELKGGEKIILYVRKTFKKGKEVTSVYPSGTDKRKNDFLGRGFSRYETYKNEEISLNKIKDITPREYYERAGKLESVLNCAFLDEESERVLEKM